MPLPLKVWSQDAGPPIKVTTGEFEPGDAIEWGGGVAIASSSAVFQTANHPTDVAGYGITDVYTKTASDARFAPIAHTHPASDVTTGTFGAGDFRFPNNVVIGQAVAAVSPLTVTNYAYALPANIIAGEIAHFAGAEGVVPSVMIDAFQNAPLLAYRRAQSAAGVLSGVLVNQALAIWQSYGYGATHYIVNAAPRIIATAEENWTDAAAGARLGFSTRPTGSIAAATEVFRLGASGDLGMASTKKFYFDGVALTGDSYITESSANVLDFFAGGINSLRLRATDASIPDGNVLYFGGPATAPFISHSASGFDFRLHASVGTFMRWLGTGGGVLAQIDNSGRLGLGGITPSGSGNTKLQLQVGAQTTTFGRVGGVVFDHFADAGNVTATGETDLYSDTVPAAMMATAGDKLVGMYGGIFVTHATATRQIRLYFGGTQFFDSTAVTVAAGNDAWLIRFELIRTGASQLRAVVSLISPNGSITTVVNYTLLNVANPLTTNSQILKITGQAAAVGAANNDIVAKMGYVEFKPTVS